MPKSVEWEHGPYLLKAEGSPGQILARAFPRSPVAAQRPVAECRGRSVEDAMASLIAQIDARHDHGVSGPADDVPVPPAGAYVDALRRVSLAEAELRLLRTHALAGDGGLSADALAQAGGHSAFEDILKTYERLGGAIGRALCVEDVVASRLSVILELPAEGAIKRDFVLTLHPELRQAVLDLTSA